jgi:hypothetical protein
MDDSQNVCLDRRNEDLMKINNSLPRSNRARSRKYGGIPGEEGTNASGGS